MTETSGHFAAGRAGHPPGPSGDYVRDLDCVGLRLRNWRCDAESGAESAATGRLVYRSWSDRVMGIFGTDTGASLVDIEAEASEDLLAVGIPLGEEEPVFRVGNTPFSGQGLDIFCLPRGSRLQLSTSRNGLRSVALLIQIDAVPAVCNAAEEDLPAIVQKIRRERAPFSAKAALPILMRRTAQEVVGDSAAAVFQRLYRRAKMAELLWLAMNHLRRAEADSETDQAIGSAARDGIERVRAFIDQDPAHYASTVQLSRLAGMNRTKMRSLFKRLYGVTIFEYRQALVMKHADELLRQPDFTIAEIGYRLGYREPSSFNIAYKRFYGHAPGRFRRSS
jgi:AraC-like DNA-binding protein